MLAGLGSLKDLVALREESAFFKRLTLAHVERALPRAHREAGSDLLELAWKSLTRPTR